jgi:gamma-glutamyltranspeptidase/glutathione hydrolase
MLSQKLLKVLISKNLRTKHIHMKKVLIYLLTLSIISAIACGDPQNAVRDKGSVASASSLATEAGLLILEKGGNAFDAAIAVAATLNVVEPMMSGLGGYGTILVLDADKQDIRYLNPSGRFPLKTNTDLMREPTPEYLKNRFGPKSISTPGNLNAWKEMHDSYGKLIWEELFESAIEIASEGFEINKQTALTIEYSFEDFSEYSRSFYGRDGEPLKSGELLIQTDLANTYRIIAKDGPAPFYNGEIATAIDKQMKEVGSFLSIEDLQNNEAEWWDPIIIDYRGYQVYTAALPANSFAAFVNLGVMREFDASTLGHNSPEYLHLFAEMTKESYKARLAYSFDPDIKKSPLDSIFSGMSLKQMGGNIDREKATEFELPFKAESKNTTHFVVADKWGNIVSATQTLGNTFGSRVMVEGTGVWLNNSMAYSTFEPKGNPMDAFPGRHKLSGDCPVIIMKDNKPWAALGTPGGHTITQNVPQIIFNLIDFSMSMQEAIDAPKICFAEPDLIIVDRAMDNSLVKSLEKKGHKVRRSNIGNANGIKIIYGDKGEIINFEAASDTRGK